MCQISYNILNFIRLMYLVKTEKFINLKLIKLALGKKFYFQGSKISLEKFTRKIRWSPPISSVN